MIHTTDIYLPKKTESKYELSELLTKRLEWLQTDMKAEIIEVGYTSHEHGYIIYKI